MAAQPSAYQFFESSIGAAFGSCPRDLVDLALRDASIRTASGMYQTDALAQQAVFLRAAMLILRDPRATKLVKVREGVEYDWERELRSLQRSGTIGRRVF